MASNVSQQSLPYYWTSAGDDIVFEFSFNPYAIDSVQDVISGSISTGTTRVNLQNDFDVTPIPGEYLFIVGSIYSGRYLILSVIGTGSVIIDTPYIGSITSNAFNCLHLRIPTFSLYKGYDVSEAYPSDLPLTKVVDIKPSIIFDITGVPYISINIQGIAKYLFTIIPNTVANTTDFSVFNAVRIKWDGISTVKAFGLYDYTLVLNSAISNDDLIYKYVTGAGFYLTPIDSPLIATRGVSFASWIDPSSVPTVLKFINGIQQ